MSRPHKRNQRNVRTDEGSERQFDLENAINAAIAVSFTVQRPGSTALFPLRAAYESKAIWNVDGKQKNLDLKWVVTLVVEISISCLWFNCETMVCFEKVLCLPHVLWFRDNKVDIIGRS
jgi:hypothetical protein